MASIKTTRTSIKTTRTKSKRNKRSKRSISVKKNRIFKVIDKAKSIVSNIYTNIKDKMKKKNKDDVLYKITKGEDCDILQVIKNGELIFEEKINDEKIKTIGCFMFETFKIKNKNNATIYDKIIDIKTDTVSLEHDENKRLKFIVNTKIPPLPTRFIINKDTKMKTIFINYGINILLLPVKIVLFILSIFIVMVYLPVSYFRMKLYCRNELKNKTVKRSPSH